MKINIIVLLFHFIAFNTFGQNVGVGTTTPIAKLDVESTTNNLIGRFNGPDQVFIGMYENGNPRGYIGSFSGALEDFDIGTMSANANGKLHFNIKAHPKMTLDNTGSLGIGTTTPATSAILDINSTTEGLLIPRMTSVQRISIPSPSNGLMVYDITTNSFWFHNSNAWTEMNNGGGFVLPYSNNVNISGNVFHIENSGSGDVLSIGNTGTGSGLNTYTMSGHAITAHSSSGYGLRTTSYSNYPLLALSDNTANTLAAIRAYNIGGGAGLHASSTADNGTFSTTSASSKSGVRGEASGAGGCGVLGVGGPATVAGVQGYKSTGTGVLGTSDSGHGIKGEVSNSTSGISAGVYGYINGTAGAGVYGIADFSNGTGVYGYSSTGKGMEGYSDTNKAVVGTSNSGTALYGSSSTGYALEANGKIKISGGNTNPTAGAVLTSDASGNAVWKSKNIAFSSNSIHNDYNEIPDEIETKLYFDNELFDDGNNFQPYTSGAPQPNDGAFIVPKNGLYHFNVRLFFVEAVLNDLENGYVKLKLQRGSAISIIGQSNAAMAYNFSINDHAVFNLSTNVKLQAGDKIYITLWHNSDLGDEGEVLSNEMTEFSCHLIYED